MKYDFDKVIDRRKTYSIKYDNAGKGAPDDILSMWIADMDFQSPPCVLEAISRCVDHCVFGYSKPDSAYYDVVQGWFEKRFKWKTEKEWIVMTSGVVCALHTAVHALTKPGDNIVIQQPVYPPFETSVKRSGRNLIVNDLVYSGGKYSIDFDDFERKISNAKLFILCSPHNPVGRVWNSEELTKMGELCVKNNIKVISDEIHQDFIYKGHKHNVFANIDPSFAEITITCTSPSKTFNIAGIPHSNIFIKSKELRNDFIKELASTSPTHPGLMSIVACKAAYEKGEDWLEELLIYLAGNISLMQKALKESTSKIQLIEPEGTYLAWLDCTGLGYSVEKLDEVIVKKAKLHLCGGTEFGPSGAGFQRLNTACPRSIIHEALSRLRLL